MDKQWIEAIRLIFKGERFKSHALDADALEEIIQYQRIIAETAKAQWRAANPGRLKLPRGFEENTRLYLREIASGSSVAVLEVPMKEAELPGIPEPGLPEEVRGALETARNVFRALEKGESMPENFPRSLVHEYAKWGKLLSANDESIEMSGSNGDLARVTVNTRSKWADYSESKYEDAVDITGEVLEADVRNAKFQIWRDDKASVSVNFSSEQEEKVIEALKEHRTRRMRVKGKGEFSPQGALKHVHSVEEMNLVNAGAQEYDASARDIVDILIELANEVPEEEWKKIPSDSSYNLDHYLYGGPKR